MQTRMLSTSLPVQAVILAMSAKLADTGHATGDTLDQMQAAM